MGENCPSRSLTLDFSREGEDMATALHGTCNFRDSTPGNEYHGTITMEEIERASDCDMSLSIGTMTIQVSGTYDGKPIDDAIVLSFNAKPSCGTVLVEQPEP